MASQKPLKNKIQQKSPPPPKKLNISPLSALYGPKNTPLARIATLLLLAAFLLFNTNANCKKPKAADNNDTENNQALRTHYTEADYKNTGACNAPDFLFGFYENDLYGTGKWYPYSVGKGTGPCANGLKNGQWTFQYKHDYDDETGEVTLYKYEYFRTGSGTFQNGKKVGKWIYDFYDNKSKTNYRKITETYDNGNIQKTEETRYQDDGTTISDKSVTNYTYDNNGNIQKTEDIKYYDDGTTIFYKKVTSYNNGKKQKWEYTRTKYQYGTINGTTGKYIRGKYNKSVTTYTYDNNGKIQKEETTHYKEDGTTITGKYVTNYTYDNNGNRQKKEDIKYYDDGTTIDYKYVYTYDNNGKLQKQEVTRYEADGTTIKQKFVITYTYDNNRNLQKEETTHYKEDGTTIDYKEVTNYYNGKEQKKEETYYKADGRTPYKKYVQSYNNISRSTEYYTTSDGGTTWTKTDESTYYNTNSNS